MTSVILDGPKGDEFGYFLLFYTFSNENGRTNDYDLLPIQIPSEET